MSEIDKLRRTMARLRGPRGCPWDQEQTHQSLARCLVDECSELLETIDLADYDHMREELGDVLIQVVFHALLAEEAGRFDFDDVAHDINAKLIRRHPHVFGRGRLKTSGEVLAQWEVIKAGEKAVRPPNLFKALPPRLPALMFAESIAKQMRQLGLGPPKPKPIGRRRGRLTRTALGRRLFELAAAASAAGLDGEGALRRHADALKRRAEKCLGRTAKKK